MPAPSTSLSNGDRNGTLGLRPVIELTVHLGPLTLAIHYDPHTRTASSLHYLDDETSPEGTPGEAVDWFLSRLIGIES